MGDFSHSINATKSAMDTVLAIGVCRCVRDVPVHSAITHLARHAVVGRSAVIIESLLELFQAEVRGYTHALVP